MAHPVLWARQPFFYPIGNTPPSSFIESLAPEEDTDILLLGCGDTRSILTTIHADQGNAVGRKLDFTCCDLEPAILARNALLLTMIADGVANNHAWRTYYHIYLDNHSLQALQAQCRKLIQLCADLKTWRASEYGHYLRFCAENTLTEIRHHCMLYMNTELLPTQDQNSLKTSFKDGMKSVLDQHTGLSATTMRAAGPLSTDPGITAAEDSSIEFWSFGLTNGRSTKTPPSTVGGTSTAGFWILDFARAVM